MPKVLEDLKRTLARHKESILRDFRIAFADLGPFLPDAEEMRQFTAHIVNACCDYVALNRKAPANSIGAKLESLQFANPKFLGEFQKVLYQSIFHYLENDEKCLILDKFQEFNSKVAVGYNVSFADELEKKHEHVRRTQMQEIKNARKKLEELSEQLDSQVSIRTGELRETNAKLANEIRDHQLAERALRESENRYRALAESADDFIFILNRDDVVEYVNQHSSHLFNRPPEKIIGQKRQALFDQSTSKLQNQSLEQVFNNGTQLHVQEWIELMEG